jgi:2-dehydro-3-deoxy-D-gluconate 5-dehydrogenase
MDFNLNMRAAIVTAATRGLGRAIAEALANEGVFVLAVGRDAKNLSELNNHPSGRISAMKGDITDTALLASLPSEALARFGRLDIIVNNAGIMKRGQFIDQSQELWDQHFTTNVISALVLTRAAAPLLISQRSGKIINMCSSAAIKGGNDIVAYCTTKGALLQFTRALAVEWARYGIQVNALGPGGYDTEIQPLRLQRPGPDLDARLALIPDGRFGRPEEIGPIACFLASPLSDHVTGAIYMSDGGETVRL